MPLPVSMQRFGQQPHARVLLVRHGAASITPAGAYIGQRDVGLSDQGRQQIVRLATMLADASVDAVYASDLQRSRESALLLATRFGLQVECTAALREIALGKWEGLTPAQIATRDPADFARYQQDPANFRVAGGESFQDVADRVIPFFIQMLARNNGQTVLVVAHGGVNRVLLCHLLGLPLSAMRRFDQACGCLNCIDLYDEPLCVCVNAVPQSERDDGVPAG